MSKATWPGRQASSAVVGMSSPARRCTRIMAGPSGVEARLGLEASLWRGVFRRPKSAPSRSKSLWSPAMTSDILERLGELVERWGVLHITGRGCKPDRAFGGGLIGFDRAASFRCARGAARHVRPQATSSAYQSSTCAMCDRRLRADPQLRTGRSCVEDRWRVRRHGGAAAAHYRNDLAAGVAIDVPG